MERRTWQPDPEKVSAESILLATGNLTERAQPIEVVSKVMKQLDFQTEQVQRLYYDRALAARFSPVFKEFGIPS